MGILNVGFYKQSFVVMNCIFTAYYIVVDSNIYIYLLKGVGEISFYYIEYLYVYIYTWINNK